MRRFSIIWWDSLAGTIVLSLIAGSSVRAAGQTAPPATPSAATPKVTQTTPAPTDIGRVTTSAGTANENIGYQAPSGTGTRAQAKAAEHAAINKIIVQPQSEMLKLPDVSIAQALSRLPGISLETDSGEGRFINIRGLDADLNSTLYDGVRILPSNLASPQGGGRAVAYDALPAGLVGGIEVIESLRPEDDAEGLGGEVNLLPRRPPADGQPFVSATGGLGLEMLRNTQIVDYGVTAGASFGFHTGDGPFDHPPTGSGFLSNPKPFSFILTDSQHNDYRGVDDYEPGYLDMQSAGAPTDLLNEVNLRHYLYNRRRFDRGAELDFDPNDDDHFYVRYALAGYNEHEEKDFLILNNLGSGFTAGSPTGFLDPADPTGKTFLAPQAQAVRTNTDVEEEIRNQVVAWGGRNVIFNAVKIDYHGAYSEGTDKFPTSYGATFTDPNPIAIAYNNQNSSHLLYHTTDGTNLTDPNNYDLTQESNTPSSSRDREYSGALNATMPFQLLTPDDQVKAGAILRLRDRIVQNSNGATFTPADGQILPLTNYVSGPDLVFYNGYYNAGPSINAASVNALLGGQPAPYDPFAFQHDTENVYAGYIQYSGSYNKLSWLAGVRVEDTFGVYRGFSTVTDALGNVTNPPSVAKKDYTSYFPSVALKYDLSSIMDLRAIYSTALARPGFNQISPGASVSVANDSVTIGNPNLSPTYADSFDAFWEYYLARGGKVSVGGFDKEFNTYIFPDQTFGAYNLAAFAGNNRISINTFSNSGPARVYGIEAEYTQQFLFLPSPFDGFGIDSNLTYNQSSATIVRDRGDGVITSQTLQLPSTSPWNFNVALFYEKGPITFRLAANYVSKNLFTLGSSPLTDIYTQQRFRLDLGTALQVTKAVQLYFDSHNLTDQTLKFTETASQSRPTQREFYGVDVMGGVRVTY